MPVSTASSVGKENASQDHSSVNMNNIVGETKNTVSSAIELISVASATGSLINVKQSTVPQNKQTAPKPRPRNPSVASTASNASSTNNNAKKSSVPANGPENSIKPSSSNNIVKKTFAKMTAAFKHTKQTSVNPVANTNSNATSIDSLKKKLTSKKLKNLPNAIGGPVRVDYGFNQTNKRAMEKREPSPNSNRRCSSVPRTLKEKQALNKQGIVGLSGLNEAVGGQEEVASSTRVALPTLTSTLGDKIQSFFNSHTTVSHTTVTSVHGSAGHDVTIVKSTFNSKTSQFFGYSKTKQTSK